ncbi:hypothetical protein ACFE04_022592 [Oxalis oulophora]
MASASLFQPPIISFTEMANSVTEIQQAHAHMLKTGLFNHNFASSRLLTFAVTNPNPQALTYAHSIFTHIESPNSFTYNNLIRAYANSSTSSQSALGVFHQMLLSPILPDEYTYTFALKACAAFGGLQEGEQIHGQVTKTGIVGDPYVQNTLIRVYAKCGCFESARIVLDEMPEKDSVSWNAMLSAYVEMGLMEMANELFQEMEDRNVESWNFMISGYVTLGLVEKAREYFDEMTVNDSVSWNSMIQGYANADSLEEAIALLEEMESESLKPKICTLDCLLSACARVGALSEGQWIHAYIDKNELEQNGIIAAALVNLYSNCGNIEKALQIFENTSRKVISTWNSIISGLSTNGFEDKALQMFRRMLAKGFEPNEATFTAILSACRRAGLLNEGRETFDLMLNVYEIQPTVEHYECVVDLLGCAGLLEEANELVRNMPTTMKSPTVWDSLLRTCKSHGNMELAEYVSNKLLVLESSSAD